MVQKILIFSVYWKNNLEVNINQISLQVLVGNQKKSHKRKCLETDENIDNKY